MSPQEISAVPVSRVRRGAEFAAGAGYLAALAAAGGLRWEHAALVLAVLAAGAPRWRSREWVVFFLPLLLALAAYDAQRFWPAAWRGPVHVAEPRAWELAWFGVPGPAGPETPAEWCQRHTHPALDLVCGAAYLLFFPAFVAAVAWWRFGLGRREAAAAVWALLALMLLALGIFFAWPAAPPWYFALHGAAGPAVLDAPGEAAGAARFDALLGVRWFASYYGRNANVFAAVPSLHVGVTALLAWFAWRLRSLRAGAMAFFGLIVFSAVYLNHHYLVDAVAGVALAVVAALAVTHRWWLPLLGGAVLALAATRPDWAAVRAALAPADGRWLVGAIAANLMIVAAMTGQWRTWVAPLRAVRWTRMWPVSAVLAFGANTLPFLGGHAAAAALLARREALPTPAVLGVLALDQAAEGAAKILLLAAAWLLAPAPAWMAVAFGGVALVAGGWLALIFFCARLGLPRALAATWVGGRIEEWAAQLHGARDARRGAAGVAWAGAGKVAEVLAALAVMQALGAAVPWPTALLAVAAVNVAGMAPLLPGNFGTFEAAAFAAWRAGGAPPETALALALVQHACLLAAMLAPGAVALAWAGVCGRATGAKAEEGR